MDVARKDVDQLFVFKDRMIFKSLYCLVSPKSNLLEKHKTDFFEKVPEDLIKHAETLQISE